MKKVRALCSRPCARASRSRCRPPLPFISTSGRFLVEIWDRAMSVHTLHLIIVFALVATVFTAFLREWTSPDLVALGAMGVLLVTGILSADETLAVFSNSAPVVIGCMFVLSAGLERTGASDSLARFFMRLAGEHERRAQLASRF